jgi:hypothetical protein
LLCVDDDQHQYRQQQRQRQQTGRIASGDARDDINGGLARTHAGLRTLTSQARYQHKD